MTDSNYSTEKYADGRIYFDVHKGRRFLYFDMSEIKGVYDKNGVDVLSKFVDYVRDKGQFTEERAKAGQYILINVYNAKSTTEGIVKLKELMFAAKGNFKGYAPKKVAVYGVGKIAKIFLTSFKAVLGSTIHVFGTREQALEWIAED